KDVAFHEVAGAAAADDRHARAGAGTVAADDVAGSRPRRARQAADGVVRGPSDTDTVIGVAQGVQAVGAGTDVVALDEVAGGRRAVEVDAAVAVAGDQVAVRRRRAADGVVGRVDEEARVGVAFGRHAGDVGAEVVGPDEVAAAGVQHDAAAAGHGV